MGSPLAAAARQQQAGQQQVLAPAFHGCVTARISSIRTSGNAVYVMVPGSDQTHEIGPCLIPSGLLGVGASHVDTTVASTTRPVVFGTLVTLVVGLKVLILLPSNDVPVIVATFPKGS